MLEGGSPPPSPMHPLQPRPKLQYKQPQRLNAVSLMMAAILGLAGYVGYAMWPLFSLRSNVESELGTALSALWRLNLHGDTATVRMELLKLKKSVVERLRQVGVKDKALEVVFQRDRKLVAMEARYRATFTFPGLEKTVTISFKPRVETDAARVDW
jgi:hypothetical protein